ncbi:MAG: hypothetical protein EOP09_14845, partial [Proteobacteria bacterium]
MITLKQTGLSLLLGLASASSQAATSCPFPLMKDCGLPPDVKACLSPAPDTPCVANKMGKYPMIDPASKVSIEGCYTDKFVRRDNLDADLSCKNSASNKDAPIRVELFYHTACSGDRPTCLNGSQVIVQPVMKNDSPIGSIKMSLQSNQLQPITLKATSAENASKEFCTSLYGNGYAYSTTTKKCEISIEAQCVLLGMMYDPANNKCISDMCNPTDCTSTITEQVCTGYTVKHTTKACVCKGTATVFDSNGAGCETCTGKPNGLPVDVNRTDLVGYWRLNGNGNSEIGGAALRDGASSDGAGANQGRNDLSALRRSRAG